MLLSIYVCYCFPWMNILYMTWYLSVNELLRFSLAKMRDAKRLISGSSIGPLLSMIPTSNPLCCLFIQWIITVNPHVIWSVFILPTRGSKLNTLPTCGNFR